MLTTDPVRALRGQRSPEVVPLIEHLMNGQFGQTVQRLLDAELDKMPPTGRLLCRCGCGREVVKGRKFVNQDHYSAWLSQERFVGRHRKAAGADTP